MPDHTDYAQDSTYWTMRKRSGGRFVVLRLNSGVYDEVERWGVYKSAGAAGTAVGVLSYLKGLSEGQEVMRAALQEKLNELGLVIPPPDAPDEGDEE